MKLINFLVRHIIWKGAISKLSLLILVPSIDIKAQNIKIPRIAYVSVPNSPTSWVIIKNLFKVHLEGEVLWILGRSIIF